MYTQALKKRRKPKKFEPEKNPLNRYVVMMVLKRRWLSKMEKVRGAVDYFVYVDIAESFLIVIIKLNRDSLCLPYLKKQRNLAMSVR